jgi:hypothetical protein
MYWLYLILFVNVTHFCSASSLYLAQESTKFFKNHHFKNPQEKEFSSRFNRLDNMEAFDFRKKPVQQDEFEGVIFYADKTCEFIESAIPINSNQKNGCDNESQSTSIPLDDLLKLRNGIFYCGNYRVCRQDNDGNVFIEQYNSNGQKKSERFLFKKFKKIFLVEEQYGYIAFRTVRTASTDPQILYNYNNHAKYVCESTTSHFTLKEYYYKIYPEMKEAPLNDPMIKIVNGDLTINSVTVPLFVSLFKKIVFKDVIHNNIKKKCLYLRTSKEKLVALSYEGILYLVEGIPHYDSHDLSWVGPKAFVYHTVIPQSRMGKYCGVYLLKLRDWFVYLKNRLIVICMIK